MSTIPDCDKPRGPIVPRDISIDPLAAGPQVSAPPVDRGVPECDRPRVVTPHETLPVAGSFQSTIHHAATPAVVPPIPMGGTMPLARQMPSHPVASVNPAPTTKPVKKAKSKSRSKKR